MSLPAGNPVLFIFLIIEDCVSLFEIVAQMLLAWVGGPGRLLLCPILIASFARGLPSKKRPKKGLCPIHTCTLVAKFWSMSDPAGVHKIVNLVIVRPI
ncbi:hypothetical protein FIBSPDRAFT_92728 [Athelia psychrophila]|uniref:Uncharacterized protein n=1 Tax=Athelia psychrophila TaxID=1759441 RepID=A0A166TL10_9AGAM|nr:hypothetical protein FIBSPDRAFT_92728 [Fibularhizoctonia sp. CBS 109695]